MGISFACTKQKAVDNNKVYRSLPNCGSLVWNLLHVTRGGGL